MAVVTSDLLEFFRARRLFHRPGGGERWRVGDRLNVHPEAAIEPYAQIFAGQTIPRALGAFSYSFSAFDPHMMLGRYCSISWDVGLMGSAHPAEWATTSPFSYNPHPLAGVRAYLVEDRGLKSFPLKTFDQGPQQVVLGHDVWVGAEVMFKRGISVGTGAIVAARSLVTKDVPPYAIVGGAPARVIRMRFPDDLVARLTASEWWRYGPDVLQPLDVSDPQGFVSRLEEAVATGAAALDLPPLTGQEILAAATPPNAIGRTAGV